MTGLDHYAAAERSAAANLARALLHRDPPIVTDARSRAAWRQTITRWERFVLRTVTTPVRQMQLRGFASGRREGGAGVEPWVVYGLCVYTWIACRPRGLAALRLHDAIALTEAVERVRWLDTSMRLAFDMELVPIDQARADEIIESSLAVLGVHASR